MSETVRCPKCGGTDATFTPGERYNCPTCGAVKWYDVEPTPPPAREGETWPRELEEASAARLTREDLLLLYREAIASHHQMADTLAAEVSARKDAQAEALSWRGQAEGGAALLARTQRQLHEASESCLAIGRTLNERDGEVRRLRAEAKRLRGEARDYKTRLETERETSASNQQAYNDLVRWLTGDATYPVLGHAKYQAERITARFTAAADCRVEAMREAILAAAYGERIAGHKDDCGCKSCETADYIAIAIRALPATPAPGPSADTPNAQEKETR